MHKGALERKIEKEKKLRLWEQENGVDFSGADFKTDLNILNVRYGYEPSFLFDDVLDNMEISRSNSVVDIGCGKGYAMYLLAKYPFGKISGIEISSELVEIAKKNIDILFPNDKRFNIVKKDAVDWDEYDEYDYYYMFNPFSDNVMIEVIHLIVESAEKMGKKKYIIYQNYKYLEILLKMGFLILQQKRDTVFLEYIPMKEKKIIAEKCVPQLLDDIQFYQYEDSYICYSPSINKTCVIGKKMYDTIQKCNGKRSLLDISDDFGVNLDYLFFIKNKVEFLWTNERQIVQKETKALDIWLSVTNACNLNCPYCYIDKNPYYLSIENIKKIVDAILNECEKESIKKLCLRFAGGEPLLNRDAIEYTISCIERKKAELKVGYGIITNGTLLDDEIISWIMKNNILVCISLDGIKEWHDLTRSFMNGKGSFEIVKKNIDLLHRKKIHVSILTTITDKNLDCIDNLTRLLVSYHNISFRYSFEKCAHGKIPKLISMQQKLVEKLNICIDIMEQAIKEGNQDFSFSLCDLHFDKKAYRACSAGISSFAIAGNNVLGMCSMGLDDAIEMNDKFDLSAPMNEQRLRTDNLMVNDRCECSSCIWRYSCSGGCPLNNHRFFGKQGMKSPYCDTFKVIIPKLIRLRGVKMYYERK